MYSLNEWEESWNSNDIGFHESCVLPDLIKHENVFLNRYCRVFLPLCGKSLDLAYLADKGHDVYGCEFVKKAVEDFFKEQNLQFTTSSLPSGIIVYKATSKKITLYCGDFYALKSDEVGKFDAVWDRGSLIVMSFFQRMEYAKIMQDLMGPGCKYLLNTFHIIGQDYQGPPYSVPKEDIERCFSSFCDIKQLDSKMANFQIPGTESVMIVNTLLAMKC